MNCREVEERLVDFYEGELPVTEADAVQRHLATCKRCEDAARETRELLGDLGAARSLDTPGTPPPEMKGLQPKAVIADFEVIDELGRGGMGIVYRARQLTLQREVALKILSPALSQVPRAVERFRREAQAAARLHHTNIVPVYAQGLADGHLYYAMELIAGQGLDEILTEERQQTGEMSVSSSLSASVLGTTSGGGSTQRRDYRRIAASVARVAEALAHAHEQQVIHRDIKPQNLIVGVDGELHITDFGLARLMDEPGLTLSRDLVGTPIYMAPEQVSGGVIDARTDVYALGMTLYEMLTLEKPFQGETYEAVIRQVSHSDPIAPRKRDRRIPLDLETICLRAIEKEPQRRFPSAAEMAADLRRYSEQFPITSRRVGPLGRLLRWGRRHPAQAAVVGLLVTLVAMLPILTWFSQRRAEGELERAWTILLADYHHGEQALAELGWFSSLLGEHDRYTLVTSLATLLRDPARAQQMLEGLLARKDLADAHYLLAWAHRVQSASDPQAWRRVYDQLQAGDQAAIPATAAGHFFKGITLIPLDPERAEQALEEAIITRERFTQAWLQQGRAIDQILYLYGGLDDYTRADEKYQKGVTRLRSAAQLARSDSYPSYLLSNAHRFAALLAQRAGDQRAADQRFAECLADARAAQQANPDNAHGYSAEAFYHEARGDYRRAIDLWEQVAQRNLRAHQILERSAYQMRLHLWLGEYDQATRMHALRYGKDSGYNPEHFDADETLFQVVLLACRGQRDAARERLSEARARATSTTNRLLLAASYQLLQIPAPPELLAGVQADASTSHHWPPELVPLLQQSAGGTLGPAMLIREGMAALGRLDPQEQRLAAPFVLAPLHFFAGAQCVLDGQTEAARRHFETAARMHDSENYCFRAGLLAGCFRTEQPDWLGD